MGQNSVRSASNDGNGQRPAVANGAGKQEAVQAKGATKTVVAFDDTFKMGIVYIYGLNRQYVELKARLYAKARLDVSTANGMCSMGAAHPSLRCANMTVVWVNSETRKLTECLPTFIHEITHLAQDIHEAAGIQDKSGELMALIEQRESERVLSEIYGMGCGGPVSRRDIDRIRKRIGKFTADACRGRKDGASGERMRTVVHYDDTFRILVVHAYGTSSDYAGLLKLLFVNSDWNKSEVASDGCIGDGTPAVGGMDVCLNWINSGRIALQDSIPEFVHQFTHLAKSIIELRKINDRSGEIQAYIEGRESERVLSGLLGMKEAGRDSGKIVNRIWKRIGNSVSADNGKGE